jgi:hypothetical protein
MEGCGRGSQGCAWRWSMAADLPADVIALSTLRLDRQLAASGVTSVTALFGAGAPAPPRGGPDARVAVAPGQRDGARRRGQGPGAPGHHARRDKVSWRWQRRVSADGHETPCAEGQKPGLRVAPGQSDGAGWHRRRGLGRAARHPDGTGPECGGARTPRGLLAWAVLDLAGESPRHGSAHVPACEAACGNSERGKRRTRRVEPRGVG